MSNPNHAFDQWVKEQYGLGRIDPDILKKYSIAVNLEDESDRLWLTSTYPEILTEYLGILTNNEVGDFVSHGIYPKGKAA